MSRSRRKSPVIPICGVNAGSEKLAKRKASRRLRLAVRRSLGRGSDAIPAARELSDVWDWPKDGKRHYFDVGPDEAERNDLARVVRK
jgi:hypothetical protein